MIILNIDGFNNINNFCGHEAGDGILMQLSSFLRSELAELKHELFRLGGDDFGSGYSNLRHLLELKIHTLKIDGSLVKKIVNDSHAKQAVLAITTLAHKIGINSIVAEFVCSQDTQERVAETGIAYSQGFFIGQPEDTIHT
ncbi:MAG: EAL domain-containing protein [Chromatiales bacterium]|nr:EAL domain-containing protein [Chromatiales bacterium]